MSASRHHNSAVSKIGGAYSHAVVDGDYVFLSGQLADDAKHRRVAIGDIVDETRAAMELLQGVLADLGLDFGDVVKVNIYMTDLDQFDRMNEIYAAYFPAGRFPARTTVGVARLLFGCHIEIDCVARRRQS
ncbi:MAG TPA: RidA family protein [Candidatus Acidoferrum sp.]|nr:RidA family protein [Candidatus Acidoferrum sp.]